MAVEAPARAAVGGERSRCRGLDRAITRLGGIGPAYGLAKGLGVTLRTMLRRSVTQQYPHEKPDLPARTRGVIAFKQENCTVCMLCARECPDWCIYIESHKDVVPPKEPGARARTRNVLDRFAIDFALCMYCGICVEVCPFDALFWSPHFEYSTAEIGDLTHEMPTLGEWVSRVLPPPALEDGAEPPKEVSAKARVIGPPAAPARAPAAPVATAAPAAPAASTATAAPAAPAAPAEARVHEAPQIDEEVLKTALAEGKSEREARAMAKKAWVLKQKKAAAAAPAAPAPAAAPALAAAPAAAPAPAVAPAESASHEPPQIDEEVYQRALAEGKSEREARAMAKKAWVLKRRRGGPGAGDGPGGAPGRPGGGGSP